MDRTDKELLNLIQDRFPVESRPFLVLANRLGITEADVIQRISILKKNGYIRRIGGIFNSDKLGYYSTLCAIKVPDCRIEKVAEAINCYDGVTHNYIRNHKFNMWFTLIASSAEKIEETLTDIKHKTGIDKILSMPAVKVFKVKASFDMLEV